MLDINYVLNGQKLPNKACSRLVGFVPTYKHFSGFGFFLLSKRISSRPPAANAIRWQAEPKSKCKTVFDSQVSFYHQVGKTVLVF
jgi:hypothetical protein